MERHAAQTRDWIATARTLAEALPYLQSYDGATVVIKFGGHAMGRTPRWTNSPPTWCL